MGHACAPPTQTGARRSAAVHPASCYSCAVAQGCERAAAVINAAVTKVLAKRK